ncbi:hypothetical protein FS842_008534 [Serendipita sp. 407]|nr:hypothetical protein FS842_008534 [Serendipita sp. 407]
MDTPRTHKKTKTPKKVIPESSRASSSNELVSNDSSSTNSKIVRITREMMDASGKSTFEVEIRDPKHTGVDGSQKSSISYAVMGLEDISRYPGNANILQDWKKEKRERTEKLHERFQEGGYPISLFLREDMARFETTKDELGMNDPDYMAQRRHVVKKDFEQELAEAMSKALQYADIQTGYRSAVTSATNSPDKRNKSTIDQQKPTADGPALTSPKPTPRPTQPKRRPREQLESNDEEQTRQEPPIEKPAKRPKIEKGKGRVPVDVRSILQEKWAAAVGLAAPINIVNEVDDELIPPSIDLATFEYLEQGPYRCPPDVASHAEFLVGCECINKCLDPDDCQCQNAVSADYIVNDGRRTFAYDDDGLYTLPDDSRITVFECNDRCNCDLWQCKNRVAQRPRDVPLEIFKTRRSGWGVRATQPIAKGKVIGVFTGDLIEDTDDVVDHWSFDLDWLGGENKWRVSSKDCGNWSRFLNHSCYPNLRVYGVIYDCVWEDPTDVRHRLAFVATKDIEAYTELTIDYAPDSPPNTKRGRCCPYGGCVRPTSAGKKATK